MTHHNLKDRNDAIRWARETLSRPNLWVIWDTETTGIGETDEIIQIGIVGLGGSILLDSLVRPLNRKQIPSEATAIHRITMKMLANAPSYPEVIPTLAKVLRRKSIVAYGVEFENRLLRQTAKRNAGRLLRCSWSCAMMQYSRFVGEWMDSKDDYKWQKLPEARHNAVADCRATLKVIKMMAATGLSGRVRQS